MAGARLRGWPWGSLVPPEADPSVSPRGTKAVTTTHKPCAGRTPAESHADQGRALIIHSSLLERGEWNQKPKDSGKLSNCPENLCFIPCHPWENHLVPLQLSV